MESQIEILKFKLEAAENREKTNLKLYEELLKVLQSDSEEKSGFQNSAELKLLQQAHIEDINKLKQEYLAVEKTLNEHIATLKEHLKDLEFEKKSESLNYQQQILDLQGQILVLKNDLSHLTHTRKQESDLIDKPQILRKQAEHIENLNAEITRIKSDHKAQLEEIHAQGKQTIKELEELYENDKSELRQQLAHLNKEFDEKLILAQNECEAQAKLSYMEEVDYLNSKISRLLTERNEAQAKLEIFRTEIQSLRDHINSPLVQKNIKDRVLAAKRILEKASNSKEDISTLKGILLHLEDRFARMQENEKIYHKLLLQKEVELKNIKEFNRELNKKYPNMLGNELHESKVSTLASVEVGYFNRKSQSFSGNLPGDESTTKRKKKDESREYSDSRLIDELALFKVKYALFEENVSERDEKIKSLVKKTKETVEKHSENYAIKQNLHFMMQILKQPLLVPDLHLSDCYSN